MCVRCFFHAIINGCHVELISCCSSSLVVNWAQLAGEKEQNIATPYLPDQRHRNPATSIRPMWSARWGHAVVVLEESSSQWPHPPDSETSDSLRGTSPVLILLGGDDGIPRDLLNLTSPLSELKICIVIIRQLVVV